MFDRVNTDIKDLKHDQVTRGLKNSSIIGGVFMTEHKKRQKLPYTGLNKKKYGNDCYIWQIIRFEGYS